MSSVFEFILQTAEAISAIALPVGGVIVTYVNAKKKAQTSRDARIETARVSADNAARVSRKQEQEMRDKLLKEKDDTIQRLTRDLDSKNSELSKEKEENNKLLDHITSMVINGQTRPERRNDNGE